MSFHEYSPLGETEDGRKVFIRGNAGADIAFERN